MAAPTISSVYPSNSATAVPIGAVIEITFSSGIDLSTAKNNVVVYGRDFDFTSGPDNAVYLNEDGTNPDFLKSPGFKGVVPCTYSLVYVDVNGDEVSLSPKALAEETAGPYRHKLKVTPKSTLAPEIDYTVYIIGEDVEGTKKGVSTRTVYEVDSSAATSTTGETVVYGGYTGTTADTISIKITKAGNIGTAEYKWWYSETETESSARTGKVTSRRFRKLEDGLQVRFGGSGYILGDIYTVKLRVKELLASSFSFSFTTSTTQISTVPSTTSTSVLGSETEIVTGYLKLIETTPVDGGTHLKFGSKQIVLEFDSTLDSATINDDAITVLAYPVSGIISNDEDQVELFKKLTVSDNKIIIDL